ncbi:MAG: carbohydrate binding family 9 domain-containing protein [Gemmatimonadota bacterium]|nr:carbohydrate binding family 9 domain-containing protein [Gemmatimonadota bacterium]
MHGLTLYVVALSALDMQTDATAPKRVRAREVPGGTVHVDGRLAEPAWRTAGVASGFVQREPTEGAPATERTEVRLLYDEEAIYVGARMHSRDPRGVRALVTRRDHEGSSEQLVVSLDTYHDRRTAYTFAVTPAGVRIDYYHAADFEDTRDYSFDPVWDAATTIDSLGWAAELRIPFSQLRFNARAAQVWGINLARMVPAANEVAYWILVPRNATGWASRFGELVGITGVRPSRRLEVVPYVASDATLKPIDDPRDPFAVERTAGVRVGGDVKMGLGPGLTLDATINPDFGQVEADPAEVNLSAFETFFDERRPFFVEGAQLFQPSGPGWFYSRRIGAPARASPDGDYVDVTPRTTILGAAKVTGRLRSGLSLAVLAALTDREHGRFVDTARVVTSSDGGVTTVPPRAGRVIVEPQTAYGVVRLLQEFGPNASTAGLIVTGVRRDLAARDFAASVLPREAYSGGVDWRLRWKRGEYDWSGYAGFSHVAGDAGALSEIQQSSRHYFQRPDADHVEFDPLRRTLSGFTVGTGISKLGGNWRWDADAATESPSFELNDVGQLSTADDLDVFGRLRYLQTRPSRRLHAWTVGVDAGQSWNYDGLRTSTFVELNAEATLKNFWELDVEPWLVPRAFDDLLTRGGPVMETGSRWGVCSSLESSPGDKTQWAFEACRERDELGGSLAEIDASLSFRPGTQWELSIEPSYFANVNPRQYVTTVERADGADVTYGNRYVFAFVDRSQLAMRARLNYAVTPDLTIESYAEPFVASGRYYGFGELAAPSTRRLRTYGTDGTSIARNADGSYSVTEMLQSGGVDAFTLENSDFDVLSFRSNVVLRWEWRPGSALYLVWQQDRRTDEESARAVHPQRLWRAIQTRGANLLAVKLTYWLPVR